MLLTILTLISLVVGSYTFSGEDHTPCYGNSFTIESDLYDLLHGWIFFVPKTARGVRDVVISNGKVNDSRFKVQGSTVVLKYVTEKDAGIFYYSYDGHSIKDLVRLFVRECAEDVVRSYNGMYSTPVHEKAEYLEFTLLSLDAPRILWNNSDPLLNQGGRGHVKKGVFKLNGLTQADNGFYNFRGRDKYNSIIRRIKITVQEYQSNHDTTLGDWLVISYPMAFKPWNIIFKPYGNKSDVWVMVHSNINDKYAWNSYFLDRLSVKHQAIEIHPAERKDSGSFEFTDKKGNLIFAAHVRVSGERGTSPVVYIGIFAAVILVVAACCCCCCCLRRRSSKRQAAPQATSAPVVHYHPTAAPGPAPAYSNLQVHPVGTSQPTVSPGPPMRYELPLHVNPTQPEVAGHEAAPGSSDSMPQFVLKGVTFPSTLPLSSDSTFSDVYTSDKLNFR